MRYCLFVAMALVLLTACQQKKTISPDRYATPRGEQATSRPVIAPPPTTGGGDSSGTLKEGDVTQPAPQPAQPAPSTGSASIQPSQTALPAGHEEVTYQIGAFSQEHNARELAGKAQAAGFRAVVEEGESTGIAQHRVIVTYSGTDREARSQLLDLGVYDPILLGGRVVPGPTPQPAPHAEPQGHIQPGQSATPPPAGGVSYQVGAFAQVENANQIKRQLEEDGFHVRMEQTADAATRYRVIATWPGTDEEGRARLLEHDIFNPIIVGAGPQPGGTATAEPQPAGPRPVQGPAQGPTKPAPRPQTAPQPAPQPVPAPQPAPAPESPAEAGDTVADDAFRFQVGAFESIENAEQLRKELEAKGFRTEMELVEEQGVPKYRVLAIKQGSVPSLRNQLMGLGVRNPILLGY